MKKISGEMEANTPVWLPHSLIFRNILYYLKHTLKVTQKQKQNHKEREEIILSQDDKW